MPKLLLAIFIFSCFQVFSQTDKNTEKFLNLAAEGDSTKILKYIQKGIDVNSTNRSKWSALAYASRYGHYGTVVVLVENGADVNQAVNVGSTPLHIALNNKNYRIAGYLIEKKADINLCDLTGMSPLAWASKQGDLEAVKLLVENGANVNSKNVSSRTVLDVTTDAEVIKYLKEHGAKSGKDLMK